MAAITTVTTPSGSLTTLRSASAQANTGQTDWVVVPTWASYAYLHFNLTAVAGTTPVVTELNLLTTDPTTRDDSYVVLLKEHASITDITGAAQLVIALGPGVTPADDYTNGATGDSFMSLNVPLPAILGVQLTFDRTTGNETYTYKLAIEWHK